MKGAKAKRAVPKLNSAQKAYLQSKYLSLVAQAACEAQKESVRAGTTKAELIAADVVLQFLRNHHCHNTIATIESETNTELTQSFSSRWVAKQLRVQGRDDIMSGLLKKRMKGRVIQQPAPPLELPGVRRPSQPLPEPVEEETQQDQPAFIGVNIVEGHLSGRASSKVVVGMTNTEESAETNVIGRTRNPKFDEYFNITAEDLATDELMFTLVMNGKASATVSIPIRSFPVGQKVDEWLEFPDSAQLHVVFSVETDYPFEYE